MTKKVLFIGMHRPNRSPSQRYRFEQYFSYLAANGIECHLSFLISAEDDKVLYQPNQYLAKLKIFFKARHKRKQDLQSASTYDFIFIQREAFMTGTSYFEEQLARLNIPLIYDFDDAIWLADKNEHHGIFSLLKNPGKTKKIIVLANQVVAGNSFLANYARQFNKNVQEIPTTIDTNWYKPRNNPKAAEDPIVIGWTGSFSTIKHFEEIIPVLYNLKNKYHEKIEFKVVGEPAYKQPDLGIEGIKWQAETEVEDLQDVDIGIMPLPDNEWTKGKCGAKGLQYMGLAIPTIMSPVGVNNDIIQDGKNGYLASTSNEWLAKLSQLIESPELRIRLGTAGRETVIKKYSVEANKSKYLALFN